MNPWSKSKLPGYKPCRFDAEYKAEMERPHTYATLPSVCFASTLTLRVSLVSIQNHLPRAGSITMSDGYLALIDPTATATNSRQRAEQIRDALVAERIILSETSSECVHGGVGHLPGPRLSECYKFTDATTELPSELRYWDMLQVNGVQFHVGKWVNFYGFVVFEWARCPTCNATFDDESEFMDSLMDAVGNFIELDEIPMLQCLKCHSESPVPLWTTQPHLGLCHFAVQFWNWPSFDAKGWRISIPEIASRAIGSPLIATYGRM